MLRHAIRDGAGQSLIETALLMPLFIIILSNAASLAYQFSVALKLTAAIRQGAEYSVTGTSTTLQAVLPGSDAVSSLVYDNINNAVPSANNTPTRICSVMLGLTGSGASQVPNCTNYGSGTGTFTDLQSDPEAPYMVLHRVDVQYTLPSPLQGSPYNFIPPITLHRSIVMRSMP